MPVTPKRSIAQTIIVGAKEIGFVLLLIIGVFALMIIFKWA